MLNDYDINGLPLLLIEWLLKKIEEQQKVSLFSLYYACFVHK